MPEQSDQLKQVTTYTFKYGSDSDAIDLNTLLLSQMHFGTVLNEVKQVVAPDADLTIKIRPLSKGSVPFDLILNVSWLDNFLYPASALVGVPAAIFGTVIGIIQLRKWAKGKKMAVLEFRGDDLVVVIGDKEYVVSKVVYNIATLNPVVDQALRKHFEAIEKDEDVSYVEIIDEKKTPLVTVQRSEFIDFTEVNEMFEQDIIKEPSREENLTVFKVVFDKGYKWQFYLHGRKISATMKDDGFMEHIKNSAERFGYGDSLKVDLEVEKVFDNNLGIYIEKDFIITKVHSHTPRPEQGKLGLIPPPDEPEAPKE